MRDTDVLARVDANEFYLLLPETGGLGAHACRRRVLDRLATAVATTDYDVGVGVAVYPHDGGDLSRLLRMARHRAEICRVSVVGTLGLTNLTLAGMVDALLARPAIHEASASLLESPRAVELPMTDVAGREIDMARRHRRRFALATIGVHPRKEERAEAARLG